MTPGRSSDVGSLAGNTDFGRAVPSTGNDRGGGRPVSHGRLFLIATACDASP
jgi:hypothetical protein